MDKKLSTARKGNLSAIGANFSNQQLLEALNAVDRLVNSNGIHAISFPEDYYFVERSLIELGVLRPSRGMTAHDAFFHLLDSIGYTFPVGRPNKVQLALAVSYIADAPFPWEALPGKNDELDDNLADLPRWRSIYHCLHRHLTDEAPSSE